MSDETSQEFVDLALEMLGEDGVMVTVTGGNPGGMTASGDRAGAPAPRSSLGMIFPTSGTVVVDGEERAKERVIMLPISPAPAPGERLVINGRNLVVGDDGVKTYAPQGIPIVHDLAVAS